MCLFDRRIAEDVDNGGNGTVDRVMTWVYDSLGKTDANGHPVDDVVLVFDGSDVLLRRFLHGFQPDQILAEEDVTTGVVTWPLADKQGTIHTRVIFDRVADRVRFHSHVWYDSFGRIVKQTDGDGVVLGTYDAKSYFGAFGPTYAFQGREFEADADLYFHRARWYDYRTGRFVSEDPIFDDTANTYRYVGNGPTNSKDPSGLEGYMYPWSFPWNSHYYPGWQALARREHRTGKAAINAVPEFAHSLVTVGASEREFELIPLTDEERSEVVCGQNIYRMEKGFIRSFYEVEFALLTGRLGPGKWQNVLKIYDGAQNGTMVGRGIINEDPAMIAGGALGIPTLFPWKRGLPPYSIDPPVGSKPIYGPPLPPPYRIADPGEIVDIGAGDVFRHFTDLKGASGIGGVPEEILQQLEAGQQVVVKNVNFKRSLNPFATGKEGRVGVTKLPADASCGELRRIGVIDEKQQYVIEFSRWTTVDNGVFDIDGTWADRNMWGLPPDTVMEGTFTIRKRF